MSIELIYPDTMQRMNPTHGEEQGTCGARVKRIEKAVGGPSPAGLTHRCTQGAIVRR